MTIIKSTNKINNRSKIHIKKIRSIRLRIPIRHGSNCFKSQNQAAIRIRAAILPATERRRQEFAGSPIRLGDDGGEAAVGQERVGGAADTDGVVVAGFVGEGTPLGGLVDGVRLQHEAALRAHRVPRRVVEHHLRVLLAVRAKGVRHFPFDLI